MTLTLCRGLPASGKSSWAKAQIARSDGNLVRFNRDEIRFMMFGAYVLDQAQENLVTKFQMEGIRAAFVAKKNVLVDDTNLSLRSLETFYSLVEDFQGSVQIRFQDFPVDIKVCIERDKKRELAGDRFVGEKVIREISKRYMHGGSELPTIPVKFYQQVLPTNHIVQDSNLPSAWIVDIDGTIAQMVNRGPYDWHLVDEDEPIEHVVRLVQQLKVAGHLIILLSGRDGVSEALTREWLDVYEIPFDMLYMRAIDDSRPDDKVKLEIYNDKIKDKFFIAGVLDDRKKVVDMWRKQGLFVAQVADGLF